MKEWLERYPEYKGRVNMPVAEFLKRRKQ